MRAQRNSSIEALKLLGAFLIVLSHVLPCDGDASAPWFVPLHLATDDRQTFLLILIRYFGQLGNAIFIIASAWFLADDDRIKPEKAFHILFDTLLIAWIYAAGITATGFSLKPHQVPEVLLPLTHENNWFVGCYLLCYLLHPWLNAVLRGVPRRTLAGGLMLLLPLYGVWQLFFAGSFYYTKLLGFLLLYLFVGFVRRDSLSWVGERQRILLLIVPLLLLPLFLVLMNAIGLRHWFFQAKMMDYCTFINPLLFLPAFAAFLIVLEHPAPPYRPVIGRTASLTLLIYLVSENFVMRQFLRPVVFAWIWGNFGYRHIAGISLLLGCAVFLISIPVCALYRVTLGRATGKLALLFTAWSDTIFKIVFSQNNRRKDHEQKF